MLWFADSIAFCVASVWLTTLHTRVLTLNDAPHTMRVLHVLLLAIVGLLMATPASGMFTALRKRFKRKSPTSTTGTGM